MSKLLPKGTKVRILPKDKIELTGLMTLSGCGFLRTMEDYCEKILIISSFEYYGIDDNTPRYSLQGGGGWVWTPEMFTVYIPFNKVGGKIL